MLLAALLLAQVPAFAVTRANLPAWCEELLKGPGNLSSQIHSPVRSKRKLGSGGQAIVYRVKAKNRYVVEKIFVSDAELDLPGLNSMFEVALQEHFTFTFLRQLFAARDIPLRVPEPIGVAQTNRLNLTTNSLLSEDIVRKNPPAPTLVLEYIEGRTVSEFINDRSIPLLKRFSVLNQLNAMVTKVRDAVGLSFRRNMILENNLVTDHALIPSESGVKVDVKVLILMTEVRAVEGSLRADKTVSFSTSWDNILLDKQGQFYLIDSN